MDSSLSNPKVTTILIWQLLSLTVCEPVMVHFVDFILTSAVNGGTIQSR